jgi:hypothetical protein
VRALTRQLRDFWSAERSLTTLLLALLLLLLVPQLEITAGAVVNILGSLLLTVLLLAGVLTLTRHAGARLLGLGLVLVAIGSRWLYATGSYPSLLGVSLFTTLLSLVTIAWVVARQVSRSELVTAHHVRGAIALYLLVAAMFAYAFAYLELLRPGAFKMPDWWSPVLSHRPEAFIYFSVITLTTLGFGDVTAVDPTGRNLVMFEAIIGQLYPAIIIARLVTMELEARQSGAGAARPPAERRQEANEMPPGAGGGDRSAT